MKRPFALVAVVGLVAISGLVGASLPLSQGDDTASAVATPLVPVSTATVAQRTMRSTEDFDGTLGYAGEGVIIAGLNGTYTRLPAEGDILTLGDEIYEVDGKNSSYLMYGERPAWRRITNDSDNGPDVKQLEQSLKELGLTASGLKPDWKFRQATVDAVKRWQRRTNQERDGEIDRGQVTYLPADVRITDVLPELGTAARAGSVLATTSGTQLVVTLDLEADRRDILAVGDAVSVEMPDGSSSDGVIAAIDSVARTLPGATEPTVEVTVELAENAATGELDGADVTISVVRQTRPDALSVPVDALLALREGGYAVEIAAEDGSTYLIAVEVGLFDDIGVEVRGDLSAGDTVVVPA
ncbi:MAG: peptidoglycan-binding protein [Chloroflexota bacterium]